MTRFLAAYRETFATLFRDRYAVSTMILAVIIYSFFYPSAYRHQIASDFPIVAVDQDQSPMSRLLIRRINAVHAVYVAATVVSVTEGEVLVGRGDAEGMVVIPEGFQRDVLRGGSGGVSVLGRGAYLGRASQVLQGVADAATAFAREAAAVQARFTGFPTSPPIRLVQHPLFNTREGYGSAVVPGVAQLIVQQTLLIGMLVMAGTRREHMGQLAFSRVGLAGIAAAFGTVGLCSMLYYNGFVVWFQDYPRGGNLGGLLLASVLYVATVVAFALFLGSFFRTRERPFQLITFLSLPMYFLANLSWPAEATPSPLVWIAKLLPTTAGINAMVRLNQMGASVIEVAPQLFNLAVLTLLYGTLAVWRFRPQGAGWPILRMVLPQHRARRTPLGL
jgi:ABC-2 type transport system permease protein